MALVAAEVALSDDSHLKKSLEINLEQKNFLMKGLADLGYECIPSEGNFISFNSNGEGDKFFEALLNEGVIVRTLGYIKCQTHLRTTIGLPEENLILLDKLSCYCLRPMSSSIDFKNILVVGLVLLEDQ